MTVCKIACETPTYARRRMVRGGCDRESRKSHNVAKAKSDPNNAFVYRAMRGFVAQKVSL